MKMNDKQKQIDMFHQHLDECEQCENNPFGLCETGAKLLHRAANMKFKGSNEVDYTMFENPHTAGGVGRK